MRSSLFAKLGLGLVLLTASCTLLQGLSASTRLRESVYGLNDETRWGRSNIATDRVLAAFRPYFIASHQKWGRDAVIADVDVRSMQLASNEETATAEVAVAWSPPDSTDVRETVIRQSWHRVGGQDFVLAEEDVISGDATLLTVELRSSSDSK